MTEPTAATSATADRPGPVGQPPAHDIIYVSRLLTDRAMRHLYSLGHPYRVGNEAPPTRAELEAQRIGSHSTFGGAPDQRRPSGAHHGRCAPQYHRHSRSACPWPR